MSRPRLNSLLKKIGGEEQLGQILQDFYRRMSKDTLIGFFFDGKDPEIIASKQQEFLLFAMGKRKSYQGKSATHAHLELPPILKGHFDRRLVILRETLKDHQLTEEDIEAWIDFENAFRQVVQK